MVAKIVGTGSAVPEKVVTNDDLAKIVDTSDEWIRTRTGIQERRISEQEDTVMLACRAAKRALKDAGMEGSQIQLIIVATCTPENFFPSTACCVQEAIGAVHAAAFDMSAACSGFIFAFNTVQAYIQSGVYENALIIGAEVFSKMIDWKDRNTCVLFGDGAGAIVVKASEKGRYKMVQHADGTMGHVLTCQARKTHQEDGLTSLTMDGQEVFKFAVKKVPECIRELLDRTGLSKEEIKYYVLHQANSRILQSVSKRLGENIEKFPMNLQKYGNTSAASIPILLDEMNREGRLTEGDFLILSGFGAGLTWGAVLLEW